MNERHTNIFYIEGSSISTVFCLKFTLSKIAEVDLKKFRNQNEQLNFGIQLMDNPTMRIQVIVDKIKLLTTHVKYLGLHVACSWCVHILLQSRVAGTVFGYVFERSRNLLEMEVLRGLLMDLWGSVGYWGRQGLIVFVKILQTNLKIKTQKSS